MPMKKYKSLMWALTLLFAVLMSVPFLVPGCGFFALVAFVPLLCMERIATLAGVKRVWIWHYTGFVLWNAMTTFWVCNATVGGGLFAIFANALFMSLIFGMFRLSKKVFGGVLPYLFLMTAWISWERFYLTDAEISWPWLVLGNSFARSIRLVQWYEWTGTLGGSLWVWICNLSVFGIMTALSDGRWKNFNVKAKAASVIGLAAVFSVPVAVSLILFGKYDSPEEGGETLDVILIQPNIDPYSKFEALSQQQQNAILLSMLETELKSGGGDTSAVLAVTPETFTNDVVVNDLTLSRTYGRFVSFLKSYPRAGILFGASSYEYIDSPEPPSYTARKVSENRWVESHNSALITDGTGKYEIFHKNKLVVAVEKTPYPALFCKIDDMLGGVMGRCVGQDSVSLLHFGKIPVGCAICYESVYGEYYTEYVRKGARMMTIITNDAWWGDTPGYVQHLSYASLRAIETRRNIARCANTGISAFIDRSGRILEKSGWWEPALLRRDVHLDDGLTFFVRHGDIAGRACSFVFALLFLAAVVRFAVSRGGVSRPK